MVRENSEVEKDFDPDFSTKYDVRV